MVFKTAKLDTAATVVTILVSCFIAALAVLFIIKIPSGWIWAIAMALIPGFSYALSPKQYEFDGSNIIITKIIGKTITIPVKDIKGYMLIENLAKLQMIRTFGNGGLFGYYGMFSTTEYGSINCQLTRMKNVVILKTDTGLYAISPVNVQEFVQTLGSSTSLVHDSSAFLIRKKLKPTRSLILMLPILLYCATIVFLLLAYRSLPERIAVHFDAFGNPDRWGSKMSFLVSGFIPATILAILNCGIYFIMRKKVHNPALPVFLIIIISFIQLFTLYINIDMFWLNRFDHHVLPFLVVLIAFALVLIILLFVYYRVVVKFKR